MRHDRSKWEFLGFFVKSEKVRQVATWITLPGVSKLAHYKIFPRKKFDIKAHFGKWSFTRLMNKAGVSFLLFLTVIRFFPI